MRIRARARGRTRSVLHEDRSDPAFREAQKLLEGEDSEVGRIIRAAKSRKATDIAPGTKFVR